MKIKRIINKLKGIDIISKVIAGLIVGILLFYILPKTNTTSTTNNYINQTRAESKSDILRETLLLEIMNELPKTNSILEYSQFTDLQNVVSINGAKIKLDYDYKFKNKYYKIGEITRKGFKVVSGFPTKKYSGNRDYDKPYDGDWSEYDIKILNYSSNFRKRSNKLKDWSTNLLIPDEISKLISQINTKMWINLNSIGENLSAYARKEKEKMSFSGNDLWREAALTGRIKIDWCTLEFIELRKLIKNELNNG